MSAQRYIESTSLKYTRNFYSCIYPKYLDTLAPYHCSPKFCISPFYYLLMWMSGKSADLDNEASDLGLHCLLRPGCQNTWGKNCSTCICYVENEVSDKEQNNIKITTTFHQNYICYAWITSNSYKQISGSSCSKVMMSLVNVSLKLWLLNIAYKLICLLKKRK